MTKKPVYLVGGWTGDGRFIMSGYSNGQKTAEETLRKAIKDRGPLSKVQYKIYEVYPDKPMTGEPALDFYAEAQKIIDALDIQGNIEFETRWKDVKDNVATYRHISIYVNRYFYLDEKTKTLIYRVSLQHYGDIKNLIDKLEEINTEIYDSLYCVEIPKMKKVLRDMNSNIRISIIDEYKHKLIPGFITK
jgi:hypothetical protein